MVPHTGLNDVTEAALLLGLGLLVAALGMPLILQKIPPNRWYGFRLPVTLSDERIWYPVNRFAGWLLLVVGALFCAASVVVFMGAPRFFVPALVVGTTVPLLLAAGLGARKAERIKRELEKRDTRIS